MTELLKLVSLASVALIASYGLQIGMGVLLFVLEDEAYKFNEDRNSPKGH